MNRTKLTETLQKFRTICNIMEGNIGGDAPDKILNDRVNEIVELTFQLDAARLEK